jgi:hypothetical protein
VERPAPGGADGTAELYRTDGTGIVDRAVALLARAGALDELEPYSAAHHDRPDCGGMPVPCGSAAPRTGMMRGMTLALPHYSTSTWVLLIAALLVLASVAAAFLGRTLMRRGMREPVIVRMINRTSERVVSVIKRPITIAVLDEVADVLRSGHYTRNIASALDENHQEIKDMVTEKVMADPVAARSIGLLPFHERLLQEIAEATLRVIQEVLKDPRTDELVSDILRDNINQIRTAVSANEF